MHFLLLLLPCCKQLVSHMMQVATSVLCLPVYLLPAALVAPLSWATEIVTAASAPCVMAAAGAGRASKGGGRVRMS